MIDIRGIKVALNLSNWYIIIVYVLPNLNLNLYDKFYNNCVSNCISLFNDGNIIIMVDINIPQYYSLRFDEVPNDILMIMTNNILEFFSLAQYNKITNHYTYSHFRFSYQLL